MSYVFTESFQQTNYTRQTPTQLKQQVLDRPSISQIHSTHGQLQSALITAYTEIGERLQQSTNNNNNNNHFTALCPGLPG